MNHFSHFILPLVIAGALGASYLSIGYTICRHINDAGPKSSVLVMERNRDANRPVDWDKVAGRSGKSICLPQ